MRELRGGPSRVWCSVGVAQFASRRVGARESDLLMGRSGPGGLARSPVAGSLVAEGPRDEHRRSGVVVRIPFEGAGRVAADADRPSGSWTDLDPGGVAPEPAIAG